MTQTKPVRAVIGTAGHIDHGKTTLIGQLTGIATDRLAEEKARGISIELGFAWLDLDPSEPAAGRVAIIDVPGHERFVRQMIAGAAGIDLVLLVVAADEGVMPQTREHLDICGLLGVRAGAIVITKTDLVDEEWLELVIDDVRQSVAGTFLADAPVVGFAAGDEDAVVRVRTAVGDLVASAGASGLLAPRSADRPFKLSVDRAFSMRGFGTVVTGTTAAGRLAVGDAVVLMPGEIEGRVRGLQTHGDTVEALAPGVRAAVNVQGIDHDDVHRGDVLVRPGEITITSMLDATFTALSRLSEPLQDRSKVLVHVGTAQVEATVALIGQAEVAPGETASVQLRLAHPTAVLPGERYVARGFAVLEGYGKTVGGGRVLCAQTRRHRRTDAAAQSMIEALASTDAARAVVGHLAYVGEAGDSEEAMGHGLPFARDVLTNAVKGLVDDGQVVLAGGRTYAASTVAALTARIVAIATDYHQANPAKRGLRVDELRSRVRGTLPTALAEAAVTYGVAHAQLHRDGDIVFEAGFSPHRTTAQQSLYDMVLDMLVAGAATPPRVQDLPDALGTTGANVDEVIAFLLDDGVATRVSKDLVYAEQVLTGLEAAIRGHFEAHETLDTPTFKTLTGASRKFTIPLGEYFDKARLTVRVGDLRRLRKA